MHLILHRLWEALLLHLVCNVVTLELQTMLQLVQVVLEEGVQHEYNPCCKISIQAAMLHPSNIGRSLLEHLALIVLVVG